ncbi:hypothetical protein SCACP_34820 [Sporomusa carbonis]|uniref:hypothetical protein n=1 Tax=Sporomusa carbonis TaxID=3076075 RepID=UPI003A760E5D
MKIKLSKKIISGLAIGCLALSLGGLAVAHESKGEPPMPEWGMVREACPPNPAPPDPAAMDQFIKTSLNRLVDQGTITKKQATQLQNFFKEKAAQRKAEFEKLKDLSPEERHAYLQKKFNDHPDVINELMTAAGLSQEQAQAVAEAIRPQHEPMPQDHIQPGM